MATENMRDLVQTAVLVTVGTSVLLVLFRISEHTSPAVTRTEKLVSQMTDLSEQYYEDARHTKDDVERVRLKAMALSLLQFANATLPHERLEHMVGYSVRRRIKHLQQDLSRIHQNMAPNAA